MNVKARWLWLILMGALSRAGYPAFGIEPAASPAATKQESASTNATANDGSDWRTDPTMQLLIAQSPSLRTNSAEAAKWYRLAADQGNAEAQYNLGAMYENGLGVAKDSTEAATWYRKAADQGYAAAQTALEHLVAKEKAAAEKETNDFLAEVGRRAGIQNISEINHDPKFVAFLETMDPKSGETYKAVGTKCMGARDIGGVAQVFHEFMKAHADKEKKEADAIQMENQRRLAEERKAQTMQIAMILVIVVVIAGSGFLLIRWLPRLVRQLRDPLTTGIAVGAIAMLLLISLATPKVYKRVMERAETQTIVSPMWASDEAAEPQRRWNFVGLDRSIVLTELLCSVAVGLIAWALVRKGNNVDAIRHSLQTRMTEPLAALLAQEKQNAPQRPTTDLAAFRMGASSGVSPEHIYVLAQELAVKTLTKSEELRTWAEDVLAAEGEQFRPHIGEIRRQAVLLVAEANKTGKVLSMAEVALPPPPALQRAPLRRMRQFAKETWKEMLFLLRHGI